MLRLKHRLLGRRTPSLLLTVLLIVAILMLGGASAQDEPLIVFIIGQDLGSLTYADTSSVGLSEIAFLFDSLGYTSRTIAAGQPIPESTQLVVLVRPAREFSLMHEARLWDYMQDGGHVLLVLDPENFYVGGLGNLNNRFDRSGLQTLIGTDYGLGVTDAFLVEPWVTNDSLIFLPRTFSYVQPTEVLNPITDPLLKYDLPIQVWGARHIAVDPLGTEHYALPLLYTDSGYGETHRGVFPRARGNAIEVGEVALEPNMPQDMLGRIEPGAIGVNTTTGSRLAVLGDSEMLQNGFGLRGTALNPTFPGNRIFAERLIAWLLEMPVKDWPELPSGYTWIAVNGQNDEWEDVEAVSRLGEITTDEGVPLFQDIRVFKDDSYVYFLFEAPLTESTQIQLHTEDGSIIAQTDQVTFRGGEEYILRLEQATSDTVVVEEARFAIDDAAELRLPLRYLGPDLSLESICIGESEEVACANVSFDIPSTETIAPFDHSLLGHLTGVVISSEGVSVNLRATPSTEGNVISFVPVGTKLAVIGRDETATWAYVENANYAGWIAGLLLETNGDFRQLPVVEGASDGSR